MENYNRVQSLKKLVVSALITAFIIGAAIAAYLAYKQDFGDVTYSNWLFYASMGCIGIGGLSLGGSFLSVNNYNYKYQSTVMNANYETRKRMDDMLINSSANFAIRMIVIGVFLLITSAAAHQIF